jgi:hypothetical protein
VKECWLVSPEAETIEVMSFSAEETKMVNIFGVNESVRSPVLGDFALRLREVFR